MPRVICKLPNASELINGVKFAEDKGQMISEEVDDDTADRFARIPGYKRVGGGSGPAPAPTPSGSEPADPDAAIRAAIEKLEPGNPAHWTQQGKPEVAAIESLMGEGADIKAADRDRVWKAMKAEQPETGEQA